MLSYGTYVIDVEEEGVVDVLRRGGVGDPVEFVYRRNKQFNIRIKFDLTSRKLGEILRRRPWRGVTYS
jgi:hypothetical protein